MKSIPVMSMLFSLLIFFVGAAQAFAVTTLTTTVELPAVIHFLTPAGDDIEVGPGIYEVEAAESWLKLVPEGQERTEAVLLEATPGTHDETVTEPAIRLEGAGEDLDVFHLGLLLPDGTGLEAIGTKSGIRPRAAKFFFLTRPAPRNQPFTPHSRIPNKKSQVIGTRPNISLPGQVGQTQAPPSRPKAKRVSDFDLAFHYAPIHYQDTDSTDYRADYITRFDFDRNWKATDNWEHTKSFSLTAHVYYSVVESCTHWFLAYGFFHPQDWTDSRFEQEHENDLEGVLAIVRKSGSRFGTLEGVITVFHTDFFSYTPKGSPLRDGPHKDQNIDGTLRMQNDKGISRFLTVQEAKGHGLKAFPYASNFQGKPNQDGIIYFPSLTKAEVPRSGNDRHVRYTLINFFASGGLWDKQLSEDKLQRQGRQTSTYSRWGTFRGDKGGGCGNGATVTCSTNAANLPWRWDDDDDGKVYGGELALDPAHVVSQYFTGLGNFSRQYLRNAYLSGLKNNGYHQSKIPRGWPGQISLGGLLSTLTSSCR